MKFIKYAVGLVIALSVIPMVVVAVVKLDEPRLQTVEFEVVDWDSGTNTITFSENTFNDIHSLGILDVSGYTTYVSNLLMVSVNDVELIEPYMVKSDDEYIFLSDEDSYDWAALFIYNTAMTDSYTPTVGDKWTMTFEVSIMSPLVKLLVGFVPLIFVGGILLFMLNKRKKEVF